MQSAIVHFVQCEPDQPQTHAIVIGIGAYPHGQLSERLKVGNLDSPVATAKAIADWLINEHNDPVCPLGSVSLLVSTETPYIYTNPKTGVEYEVPSGTTDEIIDALDNWSASASSSFENRSFFYFCGHGLRSGSSDCLLTRSFGENSRRHMEGVIDAQIENAMRILGPGEQIYFFDTCRNDGTALLTQGSPPTQALSPTPTFDRIGIPRISRLYASAEGTKAYGKPGGLSLFASEFLDAAKSAAVKNVDSRGRGWWFNTGELQKHLLRFVNRQTCQSSGEPLNISFIGPKPQNIPVVLCCDPRESISRVSVSCHSDGIMIYSFNGSASLSEDVWRLALEHQMYDFSAVPCIEGEFGPFPTTAIPISPPFVDVVMDIEERTFF
ncbi:caspase family protein (plasmid) [Rhizobium grahamii]|uniref:Caspase family protein n=1 Tax=Rhizobium grahamii TaxID=1120045 RepID=A0A5Q0CA36_9HYPH|nr:MULTISPECIES: caspase family protein [Rhizobium]QFY62808.1 caspase family protein [Rhizobium grahamii]QRM52445.1 caspase family protein [Rhizobium sp. BG6]